MTARRGTGATAADSVLYSAAGASGKAIAIGAATVAALGAVGWWLGGRPHRLLGTAAGAATGLIGVLLVSSIASADTSGVTPSTGLIHGKGYTVTGGYPQSVTDDASLTAYLQGRGWNNVVITSASTPSAYVVTATWGGAQDAPIPANMAITG